MCGMCSGLRAIFDSFDNSKSGSISTSTVGNIFQAMGIKVSDEALQNIIAEVDEDGQFLLSLVQH